MTNKIIITLSIFFGITILTGCKKDWLDAKPRQDLVVLNTLTDMQAVLDNTNIFNINQPNLGETGADNYFLTDVVFQGRSERERNIYTWASATDFYAGGDVRDWDGAYTAIFYANTVLEKLPEIELTSNNSIQWSAIKGSALFYRAYCFYNVAQIWCKPYIPATAESDLGIILRTEPDVNLPSIRSSVEETYRQIISDLTQAKNLLPLLLPTEKTKPSKTAAYAMLARTYLVMQDYDNALQWADSCLSTYSTLMNYNLSGPGISITATNPFSLYNPEVIFHTRLLSTSMLPTGSGTVAPDLYSSYHLNDRRRTLFFRTVSGRLAFRGSYNGNTVPFSGLATDEIFLIRAECYARKGNITLAMQDLNTLMAKRWDATFVPFTASDPDQALEIILTERRKELCFRGIRWTDLRRLNQEDRFQITLQRVIAGQTYLLLSNDVKYVYPIPNSEILVSGVPQNPR